jgi:hypothetical protein
VSMPVLRHLTGSMLICAATDFLKVVSTTFNLIDGRAIQSQQYSVTQFERDIKEGNAPGREGHGRESPDLDRQGQSSADIGVRGQILLVIVRPLSQVFISS